MNLEWKCLVCSKDCSQVVTWDFYCNGGIKKPIQGTCSYECEKLYKAVKEPKTTFSLLQKIYLNLIKHYD